MGIFDSFKRRKPSEGSSEIKQKTPPKRDEACSSRWQIEDKILDRWEVQDIKWGGMGIVYIALDHQWNQMFAIKTFQDRFLWNQDAIDRFIIEAETWVNLERHTNIVFANLVQKIEGKPYIFLEYIEGGDLSQYIGKLDIGHALDFAIQFCNGMDYACKKLRVIHRDIKPQNAMITTDGILKVTDFGLVKAIGQKALAEEPEQGELVISRGMGTWQYMPPEQFPEEIQRKFYFQPTKVNIRSEVYSFGVTFYQVLTGSLPFQSVEQIFTQGQTNPAALNCDIPMQLASLLMKCLEKDPRERYESFEHLMKELLEIYDVLPREQRVSGEKYQVRGKEEPLTAANYVAKGVSLRALGRFQEAIACYDKALKIDPATGEAWWDKGLILSDLGENQEAIDCFANFLKLAPPEYSSQVKECEQIIRRLRKSPTPAKRKLGTVDERKRVYELIEMCVGKVIWEWGSKDGILVLEEARGMNRTLPIVISREHARYISSLLDGNEVPNLPDNIRQLFSELQSRIPYMKGIALGTEENKFYADILTQTGNLALREVTWSEGVALALKHKLPIFVYEEVMRSASLG